MLKVHSPNQARFGRGFCRLSPFWFVILVKCYRWLVLAATVVGAFVPSHECWDQHLPGLMFTVSVFAFRDLNPQGLANHCQESVNGHHMELVSA